MTDPTPNIPFIRDQWLPALRSGEYQQRQTRLRVRDRFCCLGVAADLLMRSGAICAEWEPASDPGAFEVLGVDLHLPLVMLEAIGLSSEEEDELIRLNDSENATFPEIADYIETHILTADGAQ